ncbi:carboxypeptidase-like regulatory domain-containing protein [Akkermansiaceae bacterium]|nr:carboxypeptidase-like regulatory domain-containing protein [Akkermansiaceae bacterium]MDA7888356.1 carboxypeptidase-like regulatory domain-containing protein [Akkermansiaceae bacterium]MDB4537370.1 carboxypeptidase-like regulatory domain-containing protein [Akkermansiaceae bacterium]
MKTALFLLCLLSNFAHALISGGAGNHPVHDGGWPAGSLEVANIKTRVANWEGPPFGGGQTTFDFREESTANFNKALEVFAKIKTERKELIVQSGPKNSFWLEISKRGDKAVDARIDWSFVVWNESVWNQMFNDPKNTFMSDSPNFRKPVDCPKIHLYLGGGKVAWDDVKVPKGITVIDERSKDGVGAKFTGVVREMGSGKAMAGVQVTLIPGAQKVEGDLPLVTTGADGRYELNNFPQGGYYVVASKEGYATRRSLTFATLNGSDFREEPFSLSKAGKLTGIVKGPKGEALVGARVIARNIIGKDGFGYNDRSHAETKTDKKGAFTLDGLPEGECRLSVSLEGFYYPGGTLTKHALPSTSPVEIKMIGTGTIRGMMPPPEKGQHNVMLHPPGGNKVGSWGGSMNCKEDNSFEFKNVPEGEYYIGRHQAEDMKLTDPGVQKIVVTAGKVTTVTFGE